MTAVFLLLPRSPRRGNAALNIFALERVGGDREVHARSLARSQSIFLKPMSLAYSRKHWRHMSSLYLRIMPCRLEQARQQREPCPNFLGREYQMFSKPILILYTFCFWLSKQKSMLFLENSSGKAPC